MTTATELIGEIVSGKLDEELSGIATAIQGRQKMLSRV